MCAKGRPSLLPLKISSEEAQVHQTELCIQEAHQLVMMVETERSIPQEFAHHSSEISSLLLSSFLSVFHTCCLSTEYFSPPSASFSLGFSLLFFLVCILPIHLSISPLFMSVSWLSLNDVLLSLGRMSASSDKAACCLRFLRPPFWFSGAVHADMRWGMHTDTLLWLAARTHTLRCSGCQASLNVFQSFSERLRQSHPWNNGGRRKHSLACSRTEEDGVDGSVPKLGVQPTQTACSVGKNGEKWNRESVDYSTILIKNCLISCYLIVKCPFQMIIIIITKTFFKFIHFTRSVVQHL